VEDAAYSLLEIFDVSMPTIYREGERAFRRLQEEIMKMTPDQALFAWEMRPISGPGEVNPFQAGLSLRSRGLLAKHPKKFMQSPKITTMPMDELPAAAHCFLDAVKSQEIYNVHILLSFS
jgi:hypothetical protein